MLSVEMSFAVMLLASCAAAAWFGFRHGKEFALGAGMAVSLLAGTWFEITVLGTAVNVTMATAVILLLVYCTHSWRLIFASLSLLDYLIGSLVAWHLFVDVYHDGQPLHFAVQAYGQWMFPYASGRYAFLHPGALSKLSPIFVTVAVVISIAAIFEAFTQVNLWEWVFCEVDDKVTRVKNLRYGMLYRAIGPVRNPIFLGIVLCAWLPFAVEMTSQAAYSVRSRVAGYAGMMVMVLGILATVSRGPIFCIPIAVAFALACWNRTLRWVLLSTLLLGGFFIATHWDATLNFLEADTDEHSPSSIVQVNGSDAPEIHTSTRARLLIPQVYGPIMIDGGPMGYGSVDSAGFPPNNLPGLPADPAARHRLRNVDNSYLNVGLAFGWVGLAFFITILITAIHHSARLAPVASTYLYPSDQRVMLACGGILFALMLEIGTVFWCYDYSFWVLHLVGVIAGLTSQCSHLRRGAG